jgi:carbonic anhydrase/acetyltransferase-like protein (isoleucine patch superfamily)
VIGHIVHLEACIIEDHSLVGSGSVVLHRAVVRSHSLVGAGAVVTDDTEVPTGAMALGVPAKIFPDRVQPGSFRGHVAVYVDRARRYQTELRRLD